MGLAADKCVYEGVVRNAVTHLPVTKASIRLVSSSGQTAGYLGAAGADGAFHFEAVEPGDYQVEVERVGYVWRPGSKLYLAPGQKVDKAELWLTPEGGVSGKVLGPDGEPLPGARITLIAPQWWRGKHFYRAANSTDAGSAGEFHFTGVAPGRYFVYAARPRQGPLAYSILEAPGKPAMRIAARYHPDSPQLEGAAPVEVRAGEEIAGIDFRLPLVPVFHIRGKDPQAGGLAIHLAERKGDQALEWTAETAVTDKDSFDIAGVAEGSYSLYSLLQGPGRPDRPASEKIPVTVNAQDVSGLQAPPITRFDLKGRVRLEDDSAPPPVAIFCEGSNVDYNRFQGSMSKADGTFVIEALPADRYSVRIENQEFYLKAVRLRGVEVQAAEIDLTNGPMEDVELILSAAAGSVEGAVKEPSAETTAVLIPKGVPFAGTRPLSAQIDQDGHFRIAGLAPGHYSAFAVTEFDQGLWQNAEYQRRMASRGTAFEVAEKGIARIEMQVVPASEVRQVEGGIQ
jgi:hypothetical protein